MFHSISHRRRRMTAGAGLAAVATIATAPVAQGDLLRPEYVSYAAFNPGYGYNPWKTIYEESLTSESATATSVLTNIDWLGKINNGTNTVGADYRVSEVGGDPVTITQMYLWNASGNASYYDAGVKTIRLSYSMSSDDSGSPSSWTEIGVFDNLTMSSAENRGAETVVFDSAITARWIRMEALESHGAQIGGVDVAGWDAVRFETGASTPAVPGVGAIAALGGVGLAGRRRRR